MELTDSLKALFVDTARSLKGSARRLFMARTVKELGSGGQRCAERELGWSRVTIRKGTHELASGFTCLDAFSARGRKRAEDHLPALLSDIQTIVDSQSQTDPQFRTTRLYTRLSAAEVRRQFIAQKGYTDPLRPPAHGPQMNSPCDVADNLLRLSMDAKATVKVGPFARGGKSRVPVQAADHDFAPEATVTPVGIFLPTLGACPRI